MKSQETIISLLASVRAALYAQQQRTSDAEGANLTPRPFVTVSRQAGAGGRTFGARLVERLNAVDPGERLWHVWDRELVEKVAAEHHIPPSLIEDLESRHRSPLEQLAVLFATRDDEAVADEHQVYRRVAQTVRGLARAGRAVIVGRGGVYATDDLPGGVHVRLIAPIQQRVRHMARLLNVPEVKAAAEVHRLDNARESFHQRHWHGRALLPEMFTITLNTAAMDEDQLVSCVLPLIHSAETAPSGIAIAPACGADSERRRRCQCRDCGPPEGQPVAASGLRQRD